MPPTPAHRPKQGGEGLHVYILKMHRNDMMGIHHLACYSQYDAFEMYPY